MIAALALAALLQAPADTTALPIIPTPARVERRTGAFTLPAGARVRLRGRKDAAATAVAAYADSLLGAALGPAPAGARPARGAIVLRLDAASGTASREAYRLEVGTGGVVISATDPAGLFYGVQTLRQLLPSPSRRADPAVPAVLIEDSPRFPWRGLHLDVGRHLFPVDFIKRYVDLLAAHKLNVFHWHLTEDQGWRIEIRKYPRLTEVGAWRKETMVGKNFDPYVGDGVPYGGFYSQAEIREVVAHAAARFVTVVPEIEMPGHSVAALAAYPELACTEGPFEVRTTWGVSEDIYCPKEETFAFLEGVLEEVLQLFPSRFIHIGGDEAPKARWEASPVAQEVIRREGLKDAHELQSWFIRRIERFLAARGRRLIGWDEILEGGLPPGATVMSWRGVAGGIEAARQGHDVVMTPTSHLYLDYYQGDPAQEPLANGGLVPLERVYAYEPVPAELDAAAARHVLGAQGNVWTEYLTSPEAVEYMAWPRALALAEVTWSPNHRRDWRDFVARLPASLAWLDAWGVNYRVPDPAGLEEDVLTLGDSATLPLAAALPDGVIRCTLDGSDPVRDSPACAGALTVPATAEGTTVSARLFLPNGRTSALRRIRVVRTALRDTALVTDSLRPGLDWQYWEVDPAIRSVREIPSRAPDRTGTAPVVGLPDGGRPEGFAVRMTGWIRVPADGVWRFALASDDGAVLRVAGEAVVDHDGLHAAEEKRGRIALRAGLHPIEVLYFQAGGGKDLRLSAGLDAAEPAPVPESWFRR
ncbi:MAG TPA: family 20 glycosylhydrolase [Gemmatimonadales bacterium]|nr:family 20 glycosylhydrolase [Gemmatimonadales bacterium]